MINEEQPDLSKYSKAFSENSFFDKILKTAKKLELQLFMQD